MPKIPVDECPAGPEMDAAVAEALDLTLQRRDGETRWLYLAGIYASEQDDWAEHEDWRWVPSYSTDIAAAWELAEWATRNLFFRPGLCVPIASDNREWSCTFGAEENRAYGETVPLAICRAFLKANGVEYIEALE